MDWFMAAFVSEVRNPDQNWGERVVPFVPALNDTQKLVARNGWQWAFLFSQQSYALLGDPDCYGFARIDGAAWNEFAEEIESIEKEVNRSSLVSGAEAARAVLMVLTMNAEKVFSVFP